jgi:PBP1b-binding outer membrane lipoprotein LpoB
MKIAIIFLMALVIVGCTSVSYQTPDGTKIVYSRFLTNVETINAQVGSSKVEVNGTKIDPATVQWMLNLLGKGATP